MSVVQQTILEGNSRAKPCSYNQRLNNNNKKRKEHRLYTGHWTVLTLCSYFTQCSSFALVGTLSVLVIIK